MTTLTGFLTPSPSGTQQDRSLSLRPIQTYQGLTRLKLHVESQAGLASFGTKASLTTHQPGYVTPSFYTHFYNRIAIIPNAFELGAISTEQVLTVQVWNAWLTPQQLLSITIDNGEGIHLSSPETPILFSRLNIKKWQITVSEEGPPVVDCVITWHFAGLPPVSLKITGSRSALWLFTPDWVEGVTETLEWKTELLQSQTGAEQRRAMRLTPRRTFEFKVLLANIERQRFDNLVSVYGQRAWSLPLWHDAGYLQYALNAGSNVIVIDTDGRDFQAGGIALLRQINLTEAVEIQSVLPDSLVLTRPLIGSFLPGAVIYPTRSAVFTDPPAIKRLTDGVGSAQLRFRVTEHNAGSHYHSLPMYRGFPVLEPGSNWSEDISASYQRLFLELDNDTGTVKRTDTAKLPFIVQAHHFLLTNRGQQAELRRVFYYLRGRQRPVWVWSDTSDFYPTTKILGNTLDVAASGYSDNNALITGRQDIRIQLTGGRILYRRIMSATLITPAFERIAFDGDAVDVELTEIVKISFMTLCRLNQDSVAWQHQTDADGIADITVEFRGLRDELE